MTLVAPVDPEISRDVSEKTSSCLFLYCACLFIGTCYVLQVVVLQRESEGLHGHMACETTVPSMQGSIVQLFPVLYDQVTMYDCGA
jgi:hypothetical protein